MEVESLINEGVCCNCKNKIESGFEINFNKRFFNSVKICKQCGLVFYKKLSKLVVPKSPKNIYQYVKLFESKK